MNDLANRYADEAGAYFALHKPCPRVAEIQAAVCAHYDLEALEMVSERRFRHIAHPRQLAMYLCRKLTVRSLPEIGRLFGNRDHSTVIHAIGAVEQRLAADPDYAGDARVICAAIAGRVEARLEASAAEMTAFQRELAQRY